MHHPVTDYGVPGDREAFLGLAQETGKQLRREETILIHCGAGVDCTGTLVVWVLMSLGVTARHALRVVRVVGGSPETSAQTAVIKWIDHEFSAPSKLTPPA